MSLPSLPAIRYNLPDHMTHNSFQQFQHNTPVQLSDLPNFLENSANIPVFSSHSHFDAARRVQPRPSFGQILRSKRVRTAATIICGVLVIYYLQRRLNGSQVLARLRGPACYFSEPVIPPAVYAENINWSRFAYTLYSTDVTTLCNAVMLFELLHRLGSKADRLLLYPSSFVRKESDSIEGRLLTQAGRDYGAKLVPIEVQHKHMEYCKTSSLLQEIDGVLRLTLNRAVGR